LAGIFCIPPQRGLIMSVEECVPERNPPRAWRRIDLPLPDLPRARTLDSSVEGYLSPGHCSRFAFCQSEVDFSRGNADGSCIADHWSRPHRRSCTDPSFRHPGPAPRALGKLGENVGNAGGGHLMSTSAAHEQRRRCERGLPSGSEQGHAKGRKRVPCEMYCMV